MLNNILLYCYHNNNITIIRKAFIVVSGLFLLNIVSCEEFPPTIVLPAMIRDFSSFHPDFESPATWCKEQPGLLMPYLSPKPYSKPIPIPPELRTSETLGLYKSCATDSVMTRTKWAIANYGQSFFEEYYQDVPGVNIPIPIELKLNLIDSSLGIYKYSAPQFFPINDKGYKRELLDKDNLLDNQKNLNSNYWFTTEFKIQFYYRGVETFKFTGDDDLWVFIDGKLTSCDLGGLHNPRTCEIDLKTLGLLENTAHEMMIFHAERHFKGSAFEITTSIVPKNQAPITSDNTLSLNEDSYLAFALPGHDPDFNPFLKMMVLSQPENGILNVNPFEWFDYDTKVVYRPRLHFNGQDKFTFVMTDGKDNSTVSTVYLNILPVDTPPEPQDLSLEMNMGEKKAFQLVATDVDTPADQLTYYLAAVNTLGYLTLNNRTGAGEYSSVNPGVEDLLWQISDASGSIRQAKLTITIIDPDAATRGKLTTEQLAMILVGVFVFCLIVGSAFAYFLFRFLAYAKFQKTWEEEFMRAKLMQNPLYKPNYEEHFNPLYDA